MIKGKKYYNSINFKLVAVVFAGIALFAVGLTVASSMFLRSSFNNLYNEKLSAPKRVLFAQYSHTVITSYTEELKKRPAFAEDSKQYLERREYINQVEKDYGPAYYPPEYEAAKQWIFNYYDSLAGLKDSKYGAFSASMKETRIATGVIDLYIIADLGLPDVYVFIYNTFFEADKGIRVYDDLGTVVPKSAFPEIEKAYRTGDAVYTIDKTDEKKGGKISHSYSPVTDGYGTIVGMVCADINLEDIGKQLNSFLLYSVIIVLSITAAIIIVMYLTLKGMIISPVKKLTEVSVEIAKGNVRAEVPGTILGRKDEMGILGSSYEAMRTALDDLFSNNDALLKAATAGELNKRGDSSRFSGFFAQLIENMNNTLDVIGIYFDSISASFAVLSPSYDIVFSNRLFKKIFSSVSAETLYRELLNSQSGDYAGLKQEFAATVSNGEYNCLRWLNIDGEKRCFSFMCSGVEHDGQQNGAVIVITDSTELVAAKDNALSASRAKSEFLSRVSHELRTPLNAILSMAKFGLNDKTLEQCISRFEKIVSSSSHLSNIINDVLEMSRMESGKTEIRYAPMNVPAMIEECADMVRERSKENENQLIWHAGQDIPARLIGDEFRIKQVIINLLSNSVKFTNKGKITAEVKLIKKTARKCSLEFSVTDTGIGMSEEFLSKIFTPFEQEDSYLSRRYAGSGLGLSISNNLVKLMGGVIKVTSELGKGSRFEFSLEFEIAPEETAPLQAEEKAVEPDISIKGKKILLVDDVEINRMIVVELLAGTGVVIEEACDGEDASNKYLKSPPGYYDCVLMDIQMPKMDGYAATAAIRKSGRRDCGLPIIAMTANALKEDIELAKESGMNGHLSKPIDFDLCIKVIKETIKTYTRRIKK